MELQSKLKDIEAAGYQVMAISYDSTSILERFQTKTKKDLIEAARKLK